MTRFEYKVIPAPKKPTRARGVRSNEERFAHTLMVAMNELGQDGWDYVRSDTLPVELRNGITSKSVDYQSVLVFRRELVTATADTSLPDTADTVVTDGDANANIAAVIAAPEPVIMSDHIGDTPDEGTEEGAEQGEAGSENRDEGTEEPAKSAV